MIGATIRDNMVTGLMVIAAEQIEEMQLALGAEIVDARPYGLTVGDLRTSAGWTRNAGGEQIVLPLLEQEQYDSYTLASERAAQAETQLESAADAGADEVLAIINGEVTE